MSPLVLKLLHVLGAVLFLGNLVVTAVWKNVADRTRHPVVVAHAQRLITITDFVFTGPAAAVLVVTGWLLAEPYGGVFGAGWIHGAFWLFVLSAAIWGGVLVPVQVKQARLAREFRAGSVIPSEYWRLTTRWNIAGAVATLLPLASLALMVLKPA